MKATEQLRNEHEGVLLMLRILGEVSRQLETTGTIHNEHLENILEFLKIFVDKCHHGKEEELLFPALVHVGIPQDGPIAAMLFEHEMGRKYIRVMTDAFDRHKLKDASAAEAIVRNAQDYIALLTDHIDKENNILFAMADDRLSPEAQEKLFEGFEKIEESRIGSGKHEEFHSLLHKLADFYLKGCCDQ
ncbi:MAG: hemerythrin [Deltaproteobacteria bacterium HGW-Deltaproteobacteria-7]|nr:MAG: hemerythrin [Deltaproteobacteria bacterium HGW-Deltaproteobacteria-7]PKN18703.1 MAG: hemerythrin [Deltaproteobacteria bacterium HGW-Deltaproteobacteria-6]